MKAKIEATLSPSNTISAEVGDIFWVKSQMSRYLVIVTITENGYQLTSLDDGARWSGECVDLDEVNGQLLASEAQPANVKIVNA